jgi:phosphoribosyl 1,2-cyclic phosphate phosphodiesterase
MKLTFLGTGTSFGVPVVGCDCPTCTSTDPRDRRTRHGAVVETAGGRVLVDTPPELRLQLLAAGISAIDAVWFTHVHADHIHGIDDVRIFTVRRGDMDAYVPSEYRDVLEQHFDYIFDDAVLPPKGSSKPRIRLREFGPDDTVEIVGESFRPIVVPHGDVAVYGFRVGDLGYVTDAKTLPPEAGRILSGVDVLVLNALWFGRPHPSHFNIEEAIDAARSVGAKRTYLTHLTHRVRHEELDERLPDDVFAAYDGLEVEL